MLSDVAASAGAALRTVLYIAGLMLLIGAAAHFLTALLTRRGLRWVWSAWHLGGATLLLGGVAAMGYGWLVVGMETPIGGFLVALGLLLASAGLWALIPA